MERNGEEYDMLPIWECRLCENAWLAPLEKNGQSSPWDGPTEAHMVESQFHLRGQGVHGTVELVGVRLMTDRY